ncbi:bacterial extracellular solute-binding s, 5 Middle family protein [Collimonas arenae]|uniref:Bacterial extracellular solute-binding s, 5 Middle family protein n=1 Tax=Collimonas arenae TaxID=279058 RepID=A0A127PMW1_9BURK|nr:ABC transporter substrate-binding protein [Collimonas arenae]AMO99118.1 bacterial extracellular solute-binding s, 5 Middle family protein [Collimonas arenae]AMP09018.1 bacterial extracellular solute-binding s, 5 Middle family protein [Collimonas arenae]
MHRKTSNSVKFKKILIAPVLAFAALAGSASAYANTNPADPSKVIRTAFEAADDGFDMVKTQNFYSGWVSEVIFETLLTYDYLARPAKIIPETAEAMPEISEDGKTYTFHIKKGIYFSPDPAFKGVRRELTAEDYIYTLKRVLDPKNRSPSANFLNGKIVGLDELAAQAQKTGHFDYQTPIAGLQAPDRYTLKVVLNAKDYNFLNVVAYSAFGAVAHEAIDAYGQQTAQHPVGTGPYMLDKYVPRSKIVLVANPEYRGFTWDFKPSGDAIDKQIIKDMQGKRMPQVGRVEISIIEENQSRWLAFQGKQIDFDKIPELAALSVLDGDKLKPEYAEQGIQLQRIVEAGITYTVLNMKDPVIGGYTNDKIALRRAIAMVYNNKEEATLLRNGQAVKLESIIAPGVGGYDPAYRSSIDYNPALANKLLDHFGYKRGADGYRTMPDGKPLLLKSTSNQGGINTEISELWKRGLDLIGIRTQFVVSNFADNLKAATSCELMMWGAAWNADYPEAENFMQLLYGPNSGRGNHGCYQSPAFDALYVKAMSLPLGDERNKIYLEMNRQMEADTAWVLNTGRIRSWLVRPWVKGFKKHPILHSDWQYVDVEKH